MPGPDDVYELGSSYLLPMIGLYDHPSIFRDNRQFPHLFSFFFVPLLRTVPFSSIGCGIHSRLVLFCPSLFP